MKETDKFPQIIRSDHGVETPLIAAAHHRLRQVQGLNIPLDECFFYGTSTKNQRIESWWQQLSKGLIFYWRESDNLVYKAKFNANIKLELP